MILLFWYQSISLLDDIQILFQGRKIPVSDVCSKVTRDSDDDFRALSRNVFCDIVNTLSLIIESYIFINVLEDFDLQ